MRKERWDLACRGEQKEIDTRVSLLDGRFKNEDIDGDVIRNLSEVFLHSRAVDQWKIKIECSKYDVKIRKRGKREEWKGNEKRACIYVLRASRVSSCARP